jgi:nucleoid DNA-binding protein
MATKKKVAKKAAAKKQPVVKKLPAIKNKMTKAEVIASIAEETGLQKRDVVAVFGSLGDLVTRHIKRNGSGEFQIPDTGVKITRVRKPARKARIGRNPATGEEIKIAAKPAHLGVKVVALKALQDVV